MTECVPHENLTLRSTPFVWIIQYSALIIEPSIRGHMHNFYYEYYYNLQDGGSFGALWQL